MLYLRVEPNRELPKYDGPRPFRSVVVVDEAVSPEWQLAASRWLVEAGCLYMLAWGRDSSSWDDSVDLANLEAFGFGEIPERDSVMTTWHDREPLAEVFRFAKNHAKPVSDEVQLKDTLILHVSRVDRGQEYADLYAAA